MAEVLPREAVLSCCYCYRLLPDRGSGKSASTCTEPSQNVCIQTETNTRFSNSVTQLSHRVDYLFLPAVQPLHHFPTVNHSNGTKLKSFYICSIQSVALPCRHTRTTAACTFRSINRARPGPHAPRITILSGLGLAFTPPSLHNVNARYCSSSCALHLVSLYTNIHMYHADRINRHATKLSICCVCVDKVYPVPAAPLWPLGSIAIVMETDGQYMYF